LKEILQSERIAEPVAEPHKDETGQREQEDVDDGTSRDRGNDLLKDGFFFVIARPNVEAGTGVNKTRSNEKQKQDEPL
jgi:hypothetical protein